MFARFRRRRAPDGSAARFPIAALAVLYLVFGAMPLAVLAQVSLTLTSNAIHSNVEERLDSAASTSAVVVAQRLSSLGDLVSAAAADPTLAGAVSGAGDLRAARARLALLRSAQPGITESVVTDTTGRIVASDPGTEFFSDLSDSDWFHAEQSAPRLYISPAYTPPFPGARRAVAIVVPLRDQAGRQVGLLAAAYSLDELQSFTKQVADVQGIELMITDQTGVIVADPRRDVTLIVSLISDHQVAAGLAGRNSYVRRATPDGVFLSATHPVAPMSWTVRASVRESVVLAPLHRLRTTFLLVSLVLAGMLAIGLSAQIWLARRRARAERHLQEARDAAVRASEQKSWLLATASHEIRGPLNGILGMAGLLRSTRLDAEQNRYIDLVSSSTDRLLTVVSDLLELARIEAGRVRLTESAFDVRLLLDEVVELMRPRGELQHLDVAAVVAPEVPATLAGDGDRIRQVLLNLVGNAIKYTPSGRVAVTVGTEAGPDGGVVATFAVLDTGVGLTPGQQRQVFERFTRLSRLNAVVEGTGLGLTISRELVWLMDGEIGVDSTVGHGSRFWFRIPLREDLGSAPSRHLGLGCGTDLHASSPAALPGGPRGRLLVVDDDEVSREVARIILGRAGFTVDDAASSAEAVRRAAETDYSAVLMDMQLPDADGLETTRLIRAARPSDAPPLLVMAVTASAAPELRDRSLAGGMDGFAVKPIDWEQFVDELTVRLAGTLASGSRPEQHPHADMLAAGQPWDLEALADLRTAGALAEAAEAFTREGARAVEALRGASAGEDWDRVAEVAHRLSGAAATVGARHLRQACTELEELACGRRDPGRLRPAIDEVAALVAEASQHVEEAGATAAAN